MKNVFKKIIDKKNKKKFLFVKFQAIIPIHTQNLKNL